jgi:sulfate permease, SulP family
MMLTQFVASSAHGSTHGSTHERLPEDYTCDRILIFGLEGELFFGANDALERHLETMAAAVTDNTEVIVLRLKCSRNPDAVALSMLENVLDRMQARNVLVLLARVRLELHNVLVNTGMIERSGEQVFREEEVRQTSIIRAIQYAYSIIGESCSACPRTSVPEGPGTAVVNQA